MKGRTYRFFKGTPLYPFGHGLSYTTFALHEPAHERRVGARRTTPITVSVDVTNTGKRAGDEVVQLYVQHVGSTVERPHQGPARLSARDARAGRDAHGASSRSPASSLAYWDEQTHGWVVEREPVKLQVGASSADIRVERTIQVIGGGVKR